MPYCNTTLETAHILEQPFGPITFHQLALSLAGSFALAATAISAFLMFMHATHYSRPNEQRQIIRILGMVPVYSFVSVLGVGWYRQYVYFQIIMSTYEAITITSFVVLVLNFAASSLHEQKMYFREIQPISWAYPIKLFKAKTPRSGLTFFNIVCAGTLQYGFCRIVISLASIATEAVGVYCAESISPAFAHFWATIFGVVSITIAMYFLYMLYKQLKQQIKGRRFLYKLTCLKLVIFLTFWQNLVFGIIAKNAIPTSSKLTYSDSQTTIAHFSLAVEMSIFAVLHLSAYPYKDYLLPRESSMSYQGGTLGWYAFYQAANLLDLVKAIGRGFHWLFSGRRRREEDISYQRFRQTINIVAEHSVSTANSKITSEVDNADKEISVAVQNAAGSP